MKQQVFHVRIEAEGCGIYSFYNAQAETKHDAGMKARKKFSEEFGFPFPTTKVGYTWDAGIHVDLKKMPAI